MPRLRIDYTRTPSLSERLALELLPRGCPSADGHEWLVLLETHGVLTAVGALLMMDWVCVAHSHGASRVIITQRGIDALASAP